MRGDHSHSPALRYRTARGFTLAEVLAALAFMAIVIPVAMQGLAIANQAGQTGLRKAAAARLAEQLLNETVITRQWNSGLQAGQIVQDNQTFHWSLRVEPWPVDTLTLLTVEVIYHVQGQPHPLTLSTLVDENSL